MPLNQIFSYIGVGIKGEGGGGGGGGGDSSQNILKSQQNSPEFYDILHSLKCGETLISIFPSVIYFVGIALLIHHIITINIRPQLYRRVGRELLLQIPWQLSLICPWGMGIAEGSNLNLDTIPMISKGFRDFIKIPFVFFYVVTGIAPFNKYVNVSDIKNLHPIAQVLLLPRVLKLFICTLMSIIPFIALIKLKERRPVPQFMLWMGHVRRDRSELGVSVYYLERPVTEVTMNSPGNEIRRSNSCNNVRILKLKPRRNRSRKSVSV
ncbi:hypothetical protein Phum_PHUM319000 [Pediculus humanus corporis]|uniref:Uncharacterized protein n=1 Tax=Pediculus humanus subsp. corporis TaxID=121224 RepID=E0VMU4_PEDHC|nr:uncharacterized protein Phum_PHUM319000 [Pediculus humanus corporis]EEB14700.1 hypothetical protein Phum_PHUM319000 [Pediculus humanus corporis]